MVRRIPALLSALALVFAACGDQGATSTSQPATISTSITGSTAPATTLDVEAVVDDMAAKPFDEFVDEAYRVLTSRRPETVLALGLEAEFGISEPVLDDLSDAYLHETQALERSLLDALRAYDRAALAPDDQTTYDVFEWLLDLEVAGQPFAYHDYPVSYFITSYNQGLVRFFTELHPLATAQDTEDFIIRLGQVARQTNQVIDGLKIRAERGITPPAFSIDWTISVLEDDLSGIASNASAPRAEALAIYTSFVDRTAHLELDESARRVLNGRVETALRSGFVPAWQSLIAHLESIRAEARSEVGAWALPDGEDYYAQALRRHTTTDLGADEIHALGLAHVERVLAELRAVFDDLGYPSDGDIGTLRARARREGGSLNGSTPEQEAELLTMFADMVDMAVGESRLVFSSIPDAELIIVPEPVGQGGYYVRGTPDGSRSGAYHAGVQGSGLPRYTMATILYHEAIPGHHFQISLAQSLELPAVRRFSTFTGYVEGWALYAEQLAAEMGLYAGDPYGEIGRLELELLRAVRLVVDTGIHHLRWDREQARDYIVEAMGDRAWGHEVERYISWPGQATAYMIGQQAILDLRDETLVDGEFDIVSFHDAVLLSGALPLTVLADVVRRASTSRP